MRRILTALVVLASTVVAQERQITVEKFEVPKYPPIARAARISGEVRITLKIAKDGTVESVKSVKAHPVLASAAVEAVKKWRFACFNCKAKESFEHEVVVEFKIGDGNYVEYAFPSRIVVTTESIREYCC